MVAGSNKRGIYRQVGAGDSPWSGLCLTPPPLRLHFARRLLNLNFARQLETMLGPEQIALWVHGHMHDAFDYTVGGTRIVCNPQGDVEVGSAMGFKPGLVVEIL